MKFNRVVKLSVTTVLITGAICIGCGVAQSKTQSVKDNEVAIVNNITAGVNVEILDTLNEPELSTEANDVGGLMKASLTEDDEAGEPAFAGATLYANNKTQVYKDDKETVFCEVPAGTRFKTEGFESSMFAFTVDEEIYWVRGEDLIDDYDFEKVLFINNTEGVWSFIYDATGEEYSEPKPVEVKKEQPKKATEQKTEQPVDQQVEQNVEQNTEQPVEDTVSNSSSTGSSLGTYKLTAYCNCSKCCGKWAGGPTKSGAMPVAGTTVACNTLAMGTRISINGHEYTVQDTGHLADNQIDVYFDSHSAALEFGVQRAEVFLCE